MHRQRAAGLGPSGGAPSIQQRCVHCAALRCAQELTISGGGFLARSLDQLAASLPAGLTSLVLVAYNAESDSSLGPCLARLAARVPGLRRLAVMGGHWFSESACEHDDDLDWKEELGTVAWPPSGQSESLVEASLAAFTALQHLELLWLPLAELPQDLSRLSFLTHLSLCCDELNDAVGPQLGSALSALGGGLRELQLWEWTQPFSDPAQRGHTPAFSALAALSRLDLDVSLAYEGRSLPRLAAASLPPALVRLSLNGCYLRGVDPPLPPLEELALWSTGGGAKDLRRVAAFSNLSLLKITVNEDGAGEQISARQLAEVSAAVGLAQSLPGRLHQVPALASAAGGPCACALGFCSPPSHPACHAFGCRRCLS